MGRYVFNALPPFFIGAKPSLLWVRCPGLKGKSCGRPHQEYFGPKDRREQAAYIQFLERELTKAHAVLATFGHSDGSGLSKRKTRPRKS